MGEITTFTPEEIAELEKSPSEIAREKIAATGSKEALEAFDQYVGMFNGVHDGYLLQCNTAESALYKEVGPDKYLEYMHDYFYNATGPYMQGFWDKPFKERALIAINAPRMFHDCRMKLVFIAHRRRAALQVRNVRVVVGHYKRAFELARTRRVDAEIGA